MLDKYRVILASGSPRRRELLSAMGVDFDILTSDADESTELTSPEDVVKYLSQIKAQASCDRLMENDRCHNKPLLIIGSDTVVSLDDKILGKPRDRQDAYDMLRALSGRSHYVYTGVTILTQANWAPDKLADNDILADNTMARDTFSDRTQVTFQELTDQEIWDYIESGDPMDKAGAYGIQGIFAKHVVGINGDYNTVVGLPVGKLYEHLKEL